MEKPLETLPVAPTAPATAVPVEPTIGEVVFAEIEKDLDTLPVAPIAPTVLLPVIGAEWVCVAR